MSDPERSGGSRSIQADLTDIRSTAAVLDRLGGDVAGCAGEVVGALLQLPASAVAFAPLQASAIAGDEAWLLHRPGGLIATSLDLEVTARALRGAADVYAATDATVDFSLRLLKVQTAPIRVAFFMTRSAVDATATAFERTPVRPDDVRLPVRYAGKVTVAWAVAFSDAAGNNLTRNPEATEATVLTAQLVFRTVDPTTPPTLEAQAASIVARARMVGLLRDSRPLTVTPVPSQAPSTAPPREAADILHSIDSSESSRANAGNTASRVRVRRVVDATGKGAWIVEVPGTQDWSPASPRQPSDATANLAAIAGLPSSLYPAIERALRLSMRKQGVTPGSEPVLVAGHSQGGIVATRLAQDPKFRRTFHVTHVVTAGSPVSRIPLPAGVTSLDLAHRADPVPRLDTQDAPDAMNRYGITGDPQPRDGDDRNPIAMHEAGRYADSAHQWAPADSRDADLRAFYDSRFFTGTSGSVDDYHLQRPDG
jgi:hypothetical protein